MPGHHRKGDRFERAIDLAGPEENFARSDAVRPEPEVLRRARREAFEAALRQTRGAQTPAPLAAEADSPLDSAEAQIVPLTQRVEQILEASVVLDAQTTELESAAAEERKELP